MTKCDTLLMEFQMNEKNSHLQSSENIFIIFILKFLCDIMASYSCFYLFPIKILFVCMRNYFHKKTLKKKKLNFSSFTFIFICNSTETHFKGLLKREQKRLKKEYDEEIRENFCGLKDVSRGLNYAHTRFCI